MRIALLHPGEMGAAVGRTLVAAGHEVGWTSAGRSDATRERAERAGLVDRGGLDELLGASELVFSICPPHAARASAAEVAEGGFAGTYVDGNAVAPSTAREVAVTVEAPGTAADEGEPSGDEAVAGAAYVDGGIVGGPPSGDTGPRLFLSGEAAPAVAALFDGTAVEAIVLDGERFAASQLKMAYAAWSKGSAALLLTAMEAARRSGLEDALRAEWERSQPDLADALRRAEASREKKGWRWIGEMEEIARSMDDLGLPGGFHRAAAQVYADEP